MLGRACDTLGTKGERLKTYALSILFIFSEKDSITSSYNLWKTGGDCDGSETEVAGGCDGFEPEETTNGGYDGLVTEETIIGCDGS